MQDKNGIEVDGESVVESGSEIELNATRNKKDEWKGEGIQVTTDVDLRIEEVRQGIEREVQRQNVGTGLKTNITHSNFAR
jgi:hypothetical protein